MSRHTSPDDPPIIIFSGPNKTKRMTAETIAARIAKAEEKSKVHPQFGTKPRVPRKNQNNVVFEKLLRKILRALSRGCTTQMAARLAGIHPATLIKWKHLGRELGEQQRAGEKLDPQQIPLVDFDERCARAVTAFGNLHLKNIERGALTDPLRGPEHSKWLLTHHPEMKRAFGDKATVEHTGKDGKAIETRTSVTLADLHLALATAVDNTGDEPKLAAAPTGHPMVDRTPSNVENE